MERMTIKEAPIISDYIEDLSEYPQYIQDFVNTMKDHDLNYFYHNLRELEIYAVKDNKMYIKNARADYNIAQNEIECVLEDINADIMHELLHVASRAETRDRLYCGFMQVLNDGYGIGIGINEGYTALMDDRYFMNYDESKEEAARYTYPILKHICRKLDALVGQKEMENFFMTADLKGLHEQLSMYSSERKTDMFFLNVDLLYKKVYDRNFPKVRQSLDLYQKIMMYLAECFMTRFKLQLDDGEFTQEEYDKCTEFVKILLDDRMYFNKVIKSKKLSDYYEVIRIVANDNVKSRVR